MANPLLTPDELLEKLLADERSDLIREGSPGRDQAADGGRGRGQDRRRSRRARSLEGVAQRNGYRSLRWDTLVGGLELAIPRLRSGSHFPSFIEIEPRRRSQGALFTVVDLAFWRAFLGRREVHPAALPAGTQDGLLDGSAQAG